MDVGEPLHPSAPLPRVEPARPAPAPEPEPERPQPPPGPSLFGDAPAIRAPRRRSEDPSNHVEEDVMVLEMDPEDESTSTDQTTLQALEVAWEGIVMDVLQHEKQLGSFLRQARLTAFESKALLLSVPDDFHAKALRNERARLAHRLSEATGLHVERIGFRVDSPEGDRTEAADEEVNARETLQTLCEEHPAVRALVERFGGEIVW